MFHWCHYLVEFFNIKDISHPLLVGFIGRKRSVDFSDTTLESWKKIIPSKCYRIRDQDKEIIIKNGVGNEVVKVNFGGLDNQETINKFNSSELAFCCIDQAEETLQVDVAVLQASLRLTYEGKIPPYKQLYTANPSECWLKDRFIIGNDAKHHFIPALPDDNPFLPPNYKQTLRDSFSYDPALLKAYLLGDWDAFSNVSDALCKAIHFEVCRNNKLDEFEPESLRIVASDVATKHGECSTIVMYRYGHTIKEIAEFKKIPTTKIAFYIKQEYEKRKANTCVVDSDGFGEGVADVLDAQHVHPLEFHGGYSSHAQDKYRFRNLRSQFSWITAKKLEKGLYDFSFLPQEVYAQLKRQSCAIKVRPPDPTGRFQIETKEDMRARGVKSPDLWDSLVYSEYGYYMGNMAEVKPYAWR